MQLIACPCVALSSIVVQWNTWISQSVHWRTCCIIIMNMLVWACGYWEHTQHERWKWRVPTNKPALCLSLSLQCGVCKGQLGDTTTGTDVRIRNGLLNCHQCYIRSRCESLHLHPSLSSHVFLPSPSPFFLSVFCLCFYPSIQNTKLSPVTEDTSSWTEWITLVFRDVREETV